MGTRSTNRAKLARAPVLVLAAALIALWCVGRSAHDARAPSVPRRAADIETGSVPDLPHLEEDDSTEPPFRRPADKAELARSRAGAAPQAAEIAAPDHTVAKPPIAVPAVSG